MTLALLTAATLLLATIPQLATPERCDLIETNHFHDDEGKLVFTQHIAYDWHARHGTHHVCGWELCKGQFARRDFNTGEWVLCLKDRVLRARTFRETWTQHDPELIDREAWPVGKRRLGR